MLCPISHRVPEQPVVTPQGHCYEKRLLEEYRKTHGDIDPVTGESFDPERLVELKQGATANAEAESLNVSQLLLKVQNEFDLVLLQNFKLRTALDAMKGQLSQSLYQHDAACRVVARLTRERDMWKNRISSAPSSAPDAPTVPSFSPEKIAEIFENAVDLQNSRKSKTLAQYAVEDLDKWTCTSSAVPHEAARPGVTDLAIKEQSDRGNVVVTSGLDGHITMTSLSTMSRITRFQGSDRSATCLDVHPDADVIVAGFDDKAIRFYTGSMNGEDLEFSLHKMARAHSDVVKSIEIHPLGDFVMSGGADDKIVFTDIDSGKYMGTPLAVAQGLNCLKFHPDGNIFLDGCKDGSVGIWDIRAMEQTMRFQENQNKSGVSGLVVAENGFYLTTADTSGNLKVFDLRKFPGATAPVTSKVIVDDPSALGFNLCLSNMSSLVASVGSDSQGHGIVRIGSVGKRAKEISFGSVHMDQHKDHVTRCLFVPNKDELVTVSKDNTVALWKPQTA